MNGSIAAVDPAGLKPGMQLLFTNQPNPADNGVYELRRGGWQDQPETIKGNRRWRRGAWRQSGAR